MAQKLNNSHDTNIPSTLNTASNGPTTTKSKQRQNGLPVSIHPDDAKDKVFTAILKALLKMGNKPSSPKELANIIVKHKYATLGGATPFATVSSRISQHFKRAAEHNPPRAPLLAKHVDQNHSRKINYSLATADGENATSAANDNNNNNNSRSSSSSSSSSTAATEEIVEKVNNETHDSITTTNSTTTTTTAANTKDKLLEQQVNNPNPNPTRTNSKTRRKQPGGADEQEDSEEDDEEEDDLVTHITKRHKQNHSPTPPPNLTNIGDTTTGSGEEEEEEMSEGELSDYHEEMLKGDEDLEMRARRLSRRQSSIFRSRKSTTHHDTILHNQNTSATNSTTAIPSTVPSSMASSSTTGTRNVNNATAATTGTAATVTDATTSINTPQPPSSIRKPSFSFSSGFPGEQELWTPFSFEHDFDNVFLPDASSSTTSSQHNTIPFNIATPESISVSELDNYFTSIPPARSQRKSFSSTMLGPNDKSLLQKVLLASAARGVADKIEEHDEEEENENSNNKKQKEKEGVDVKIEKQAKENSQLPLASSTNTSIGTAAAVNNSTTRSPLIGSKEEQPVISSSSLMDVDNGEDFVKFEDDEKKEIPAIVTQPQPQSQQPQHILPSIYPTSAAAHGSNITGRKPPEPLSINTAPQSPATTLSTAEILKSMNIQNLNLSALHQMTSNIPSLQHLSPTFDLAKTMAAYMQTLAKSANANNASSSPNSSPHAMDLKSILTRFPALEAFIKKDPPLSINTTAGTSTPPLLSPTTDYVPSLISTHSVATTLAGNNGIAPNSPTEPIVHSLTAMNPPMYITLIDNIAVCIVILAKTDTAPEYRIMRRVDTGFINGTVLLTAGGIETESERSMILSFEMERIRMPKKKSQLFGTWIPLRRAQELAVTCSIQHKLGHFLDDSIESFFPNPLPIATTRKPTRDSRLTALALAALRSSSSEQQKANGFVMPSISRQSSSGSMAAAQLQELLLTHPHKALKSNGLMKPPLLNSQQENEEEEGKARRKHSDSMDSNSSHSGASQNNPKGEESDVDVDVDVVNSSDSSAASSANEASEDEEEGQQNSNSSGKKKMHGGLDLEEMINRVTQKQQQPLHVHPRDLQKKRRRSHVVDNHSDSSGEAVEGDDLEEPLPKLSKSVPTPGSNHTGRKRTSNSAVGANGGKWSSSSSNNNTSNPSKSSGKKGGGTALIKKSGSSGGHSNSNSNVSNNKKNGKKDSHVVKEETITNVVVKHKSSAALSVKEEVKSDEEDVAAIDTTTNDDNEEDEEDEDIDIGGSDFDDDLR